MPIDQEKESFLRTEYEVLAKIYEIQFTHFMGVFYFWIAVIGLPTTAGVITQSVSLGALCIVVGLLGVFLVAKMFDIRHSQFRYIAKMNELRGRFWSEFKIEKADGIEMLGKNADLEKIVRKDFGIIMAWVMSLVNSILIAGGVYFSTSSYSQCASLTATIAVWILTLAANVHLYYRIVVWKIPELLPKSKLKAA